MLIHRYIPAIYDPSTSTLTIHPDTPLYLMSTTVKRLKAPAPATVYADAMDRAKAWRKNRDALGETFGTRKAKSQIKAEERNKVDVGAMEGVKGHLLGSIAERTVVEGMSLQSIRLQSDCRDVTLALRPVVEARGKLTISWTSRPHPHPRYADRRSHEDLHTAVADTGRRVGCYLGIGNHQGRRRQGADGSAAMAKGAVDGGQAADYHVWRCSRT